jgi:hypothetical protein
MNLSFSSPVRSPSSSTCSVPDRRLHQSLGDVEANQLTWDIHQLMSIDPTLFMSPSQKDQANFIRLSPMKAMTADEENIIRELLMLAETATGY